MRKMKTDDIQTISPETLQTEYVSPAHCIFSLTEYGFLSAEINGEKYGRVILTEAMPLTMPDKYICISDIEKREIGIIEDISGFGEDQQKLIMSELSQRYYSPVITEIQAIKEKFGNFYFDVKIGEHKKNFTVKDISKNIRNHGEGFDLVDIDGNRYRITDFKKIPAKSRRKLEPYLY